jgi:hypothetical protein
MANRFERIPAPALESRLPGLAGREAHVVLRSGQTFRGRLLPPEGGMVLLQDGYRWWYSRRRHLHRFAPAELRELVVEGG